MTENQVSRETLIPDRTEAAQDDLRTSTLPVRIVEFNDGFITYPAIQLDSKPARKQVRDKNGRAFGSVESCEAIPMSYDNAKWMLAATYGMDVAEAMLFRAESEPYVFGEKHDLSGRGKKGKIKGGMNVAKDQSRDSGYVIQVVAFVQGGIK